MAFFIIGLALCVLLVVITVRQDRRSIVDPAERRGHDALRRVAGGPTP